MLEIIIIYTVQECWAFSSVTDGFCEDTENPRHFGNWNDFSHTRWYVSDMQYIRLIIYMVRSLL